MIAVDCYVALIGARVDLFAKEGDHEGGDDVRVLTTGKEYLS